MKEDPREFQGSFKCVSRVSQETFKGVSRKFQGSFKEDWNGVLGGCKVLNVFYRKFHASFKEVSMVFLGKFKCVLRGL